MFKSMRAIILNKIHTIKSSNKQFIAATLATVFMCGSILLFFQPGNITYKNKGGRQESECWIPDTSNSVIESSFCDMNMYKKAKRIAQ